MNQAAFYLPIAKIDRDKHMVFGYASTPTLDLDGEIVEADAIKKALPDYMEWRNIREMHTSSAVGVTKEANVDEKGLFIGAKIVDDDAWKKVMEEVYKGFSIGGNVTEREGKRITGLELLEISLVDRPANPDCRIEVIKAAGISKDRGMADLSAGEPLLPPDRGEVGWLRRMVEKLAGGKIEKADDAPGNGKLPHGDVAYADPGYQEDGHKRYPIDTEEHIRAAWNYIHRKRNADKYSAEQLAGIKGRIEAAWKAKIDPKGPPEAEKAALDDEAPEPDASNLIEDNGEFQPEHLPKRGDGLSAPAGKVARATAGALAKSMSAAGTLVCVADMLECAEACLRAEGGDEGGDVNDYALADCVCDIRCDVLDVIAQKAMHEAEEDKNDGEDNSKLTVNLSGADKMADSPLAKRAATGRHMDHLKKAAAHVSEAHRLLERAARGRDDADKAVSVTLRKEAADAHEQAMEHLVLAGHHIRAAAGERAEAPFEADSGDFGRGEARSGHVYEPEQGIEGVGSRQMTEGSVDGYESDKPYPGKAATPKGDAITKREAEAMAEAAYLRGKVEAMEKAPASPKARLFAVPRGAFPVGRDEEPSAKERLLRGVNLDAQDAGERQRAAGRMLGNMLTNPGTFARPVIGDATFKGAAGSH